MTKRRAFAPIAFVAILIAAAVQVSAQQQVSADIEVRASVVANCKLTLTPLDFGTYDPLGSNQATSLDTTAKMVLVCTPKSQVAIDLDQGQNALLSTQSLMRGMTSGTSALGYQVYRDAARTQLWGTGADALQFVSRRADISEEFTVYARVPAGQPVDAGSYTDVLTATVHF